MTNKKQILITGVAGFIGSNLLDFLVKETDWLIDGIDDLSTGNEENIKHNLDNKRFTFYRASCDTLGAIKKYDYIFHLAALPRIQPSFQLIKEHIHANLIQSVHLIELMIKENVYPKLIYSGSSAIYGTPKTIPTPETELIDCLSPYAFQKYEVEKYLELIATRYPINYVTLRYFNPYGPRSFNTKNPFNAYSSVIGIFLNKLKNGQKLQITGNGSQSRDFIHVYDLANANYMAAIHPEILNTSFNIGYGSTLTILDLAKMITPEDYEFISKREGEAQITFADNTKAKNILNWKPTYELAKYILKEVNKIKEIHA